MTEATWCCKLCGESVAMHFNHVGRCESDSTEANCSGTFIHWQAFACSKTGQDLTHSMVEVRVSRSESPWEPPGGLSRGSRNYKHGRRQR